jgi:hypothetical protein
MANVTGVPAYYKRPCLTLKGLKAFGAQQPVTPLREELGREVRLGAQSTLLAGVPVQHWPSKW